MKDNATDINFQGNDVESYDKKLNDLKDSVKLLKKIKRREKKIKELEREQKDIIKGMEKKR